MHCSSPVASSHGLLTTMALQPGPEAAPQYALEGECASLAAMAASTLMMFSAVGPGHQSQQPPAVCAGSIAIAGAGVSWLRDKLQVTPLAAQMHNARRHCAGWSPLAVGPSIEALRASPTAQVISSAAESEELAASVGDTAGVYFVPAFSGLLAPRWRSDARGVIVGLTSYSTKASAVTLGVPPPRRTAPDLMLALPQWGLMQGAPLPPSISVNAGSLAAMLQAQQEVHPTTSASAWGPGLLFRQAGRRLHVWTPCGAGAHRAGHAGGDVLPDTGGGGRYVPRCRPGAPRGEA